MITIKKGPMTITRSVNDIKALTDTPDGLYIKFSDDVELIFSMPVTPPLKAIVTTVLKMSWKNIVIDLDNKTNMLSVEN